MMIFDAFYDTIFTLIAFTDAKSKFVSFLFSNFLINFIVHLIIQSFVINKFRLTNIKLKDEL